MLLPCGCPLFYLFSEGQSCVYLACYYRTSGGGKQTLVLRSTGTLLPCAVPSSRLMQKPHPNLVTRTTRHSSVFKTDCRVENKLRHISWFAESEACCRSLKQSAILKGWLLVAEEQMLLSVTFYFYSFCFYSLGLYKDTLYVTDYLKKFFSP